MPRQAPARLERHTRRKALEASITIQKSGNRFSDKIMLQLKSS
jgi:hypothetical protein